MMELLEAEIQVLVWTAAQVMLIPGGEHDARLRDRSLVMNDDIGRSFDSFRHNLLENLRLGALPHDLVQASELELLFQRKNAAAQIRTLKGHLLGGVPSPEQKTAAYDLAKQQVKDIVSSPNIFEGEAGEFRRSYISKLAGIGNDIRFKPSLGALGRACMVNAWYALEVFTKDLMVDIFNKRPILYERIEKSQEATKRFEARKFSLAELSKFGYDVSRSLGDLIFSDKDFSDIATIRCAVFAVFPDNAKLRSAVASSELYHICKKRHLIVHRRGVIDAAYEKAVGDEGTLGKEISFSSSDIVSATNVVFETGLLLLFAARLALSEDDS